MDSYDPETSNSEQSSDTNVFIIIGFLSFCVLAFLFWLIYFKTGPSTLAQGWVNSLPALNACLNTLTVTFLVSGFALIKQNKIDWHKRAMYTATATSAIFLISYITYHHFHGDTKFIATGLIRPVYFGILISHIILSMVQVPLILATLYLGITKKFVKHKKVARITFPIWLYVSVTGVLIFIILNWFNV